MPAAVLPDWVYTLGNLGIVLNFLFWSPIPVMDKKITIVEWAERSNVPLEAWMVEAATGLPAGSL